MMRRTAAVLGTWLTATALAFAVANSAYAAHGALIIDGGAHPNPSGCFMLGDFVQPTVTNLTDSVVEVWNGVDCTGRLTHFIAPGDTYRPIAGRSVFVP
ncbi:hypothetical protein [Kitasatospora sp. NPDC093806]|uniref:hypothetical protein n=1 Tax=Kitasatospora sp. NPDC093806 TaxID=3155075 RepID=UPI003423DD4F